MLPRSRSRKAVASLAAAILGILLGWALAFLLLTPLAAVLAVLALVDIHHGRAIKGRVLAWCAIALAVIAPALWLWLFVEALGRGGGAAGVLGFD